MPSSSPALPRGQTVNQEELNRCSRRREPNTARRIKAADLRAKTADEVKDQLVDLKKEQFNLRFQVAGGQNENPARARIVRREIARIKTVLGEMASAAGAA